MVAQPAETECTCVPVNVLKSDIDEGRSPFGEDDEFCYQVDSKLVYGNRSDVNGKTMKFSLSHFKNENLFQIQL